MKKLISFLLFPLICSTSFGQNKAEAEKLIEEGISYHDKGDYVGAILKYDKALELDKDNLFALAEKAYSLLSIRKYEQAIICCEKAIAIHPGESDLKTVYVAYGNAHDGLKKTEKAIEIYDQGIKLFPEYYQLYFNKGISLSGLRKYDDALLCFQKSIMLNPNHASSHNAMARISYNNNKTIPALLSYCRFLAIEPQSNRAKENLTAMQKIMRGNAEETGKNSITINISPDLLGDTTENGKPKENSFSTTNLILAMSAALDFEKTNKKKTAVEQFIRKFETVCSTLKETQKGNYGFYWDYYVPYFIELQDKKFIETFAYIAFASSEDKKVAKWLKNHKSETNQFFEWSKSFQWKIN